MIKTIEFANRKIGPGNPCFIIAEAGVNHNGSLEMAHRLIDLAAESGADAIKFQTFKADRLVTEAAPTAGYQQANLRSSESQLQMLRRLELSEDSYTSLWTHCQEKQLLFMSTPFDEQSADFLEALGVAVFKIPSGEITNLPYLAHIARKRKPMIVSTGMSDLGEVQTAVETIQSSGNEELILLHCVSSYPADPAEVNLRAMHTLNAAFGFPVGFSDHTLGIEVPLAAVALGACVIEKHFTLDRSLPGPDHRASLEPGELAVMIAGIRKVETALGTGVKRPTPGELDTARVARKSLVAACLIPEGELISEQMVAIKRPGNGLPPGMRGYLIGRRARREIPAGTVLSLEMIA